jgi:hypothetical protein
MLNESGTTLTWVAYTAPTSTNGVPNDMINLSVTNIPNGSSQRIVWDSATYTNGIIPIDAAFTGDWEFEFFTYSNGLTATNINRHSRLKSTTGQVVQGRAGSALTTFDYSDVFDVNNNFTGVFAEITSGAIGVNNINSEYTSNTSDSYTITLDDLYWGDTETVDSSSTLRVWNGSAFVKSAVTGTWGKGTTSGTNGFNELLATEMMKCQAIASQRMNVSSALSETDKLTSTKLKMVNPVGRLKDVNSEKYVLLSGTYNTLRDEWNGVWFQFTYDTGIVVTTADENQTGPLSGPVLGGGNQGNAFGNGAQSMVQPWGATTINQRIAAGSITSLNISTVNEAIIYSGDRIYLTDNKSGDYLEFEVSADVGATDTTISVVAQTITEDIREGTVIGIDMKNLFQQYQRKTEGTIAGMPVTSDAIGKYEYKGGSYFMVGVDTTFVKVLPRDFVINDDGSNEALEFKDGTNTGLTVGDSSQEMIATVNIPSGTTATEVTIWSSSTARTVEIYEASVASNGIGSAIGTGTANGSPISITATAATTTNYLVILVKVTNTSNRVYGGQVTLTQN